MSDNTTTTTAPVRFVAPKNTFQAGAADNESRGIVEAGIFDDTMLNIVIDTSKHIAYNNAKGDVQVLAKTGKITLDNGDRLSLMYERDTAEKRAARLAKDIKQKVRKVIKGTATAEDMRWLMRNGFEAKDGRGDGLGTLDAGKVECAEADYKAAETAARAKAKMAENNGSLQARINEVLKGAAQ